MEKRIEHLIKFCQGIYHGENGKALYDQYLSDIDTITPKDVFLIEYEQLEMGITPKEMLTYLDKLINVFYSRLSEYSWNKPKKGTFLDLLMKENVALESILKGIKVLIKKGINHDVLLLEFKKLEAYNSHMLKLENILFPSMEMKQKKYEGLKIMWSLHDETRKCLKKLLDALANKAESHEVYALIGQLFFKYYGLVQKQTLIMFPVASEILDEKTFEIMHVQSFEYGFSYIDTPVKPKKTLKDLMGLNNHSTFLETETGHLIPEQIVLMLNTLPVDITLVDENDKVAYFSNNKERIFPRSAAVIGRDVRNCHPPESVHVVEEIIENFKSGKRDQENFWIQMKGLFIMIQYFALRDDLGCYKGTLEVSQEITELRNLEGQKRLLD